MAIMPTVFKGLQFRTIASLLSLAEIFRRVDTPKISRTVRSAPLHRCGNDLRHGPKASRRYGRTGRTQAGRIFALPFECRCRLCLTPSHALSKISPNATKSGPGMARASYSRAIWCHDCQINWTYSHIDKTKVSRPVALLERRSKFVYWKRSMRLIKRHYVRLQN